MGVRGPQRGCPMPANKLPLHQRIAEDKLDKGRAKILDFAEPIDTSQTPERAFLLSLSKNKTTPSADEMFERMETWLNASGCRHLVQDDLITGYSLAMARWLECEEINTEHGLLAKRKDGEAVLSPYVKASLEYSRVAQGYFKQIYQVVYDNAQVDFRKFQNPNEDPMFKLLRERKA